MNRRIAALRALADRPGTEHEGIVAREILARLEAKGAEGYRDYEAEYLAAFRRHLRGEITLEEFLRSWRSTPAAPSSWKCPCGDMVPAAMRCSNTLGHLNIQTEIRTKFKRGDRVFYNYWAYPKNCPGEVRAFVKLQKENGTFPWGWISVKFDHLKSTRRIPILTVKGWHLTLDPLSDEEAERMGRP